MLPPSQQASSVPLPQRLATSPAPYGFPARPRWGKRSSGATRNSSRAGCQLVSHRSTSQQNSVRTGTQFVHVLGHHRPVDWVEGVVGTVGKNVPVGPCCAALAPSAPRAPRVLAAATPELPHLATGLLQSRPPVPHIPWDDAPSSMSCSRLNRLTRPPPTR